jgi:hypothetical protein
MKIMYISIALIAIYFVFQSFIAVNASKTEKQKYRVVFKDAELEIRFYPEATMATVYSEASNYKGAANSGFRKLARFIFGGNEQNQGIAMTAPVRMNMSEKGSEMSFVMPEKYNESSLPTPKDKTINIHKSAPQYVAVISFGGYANDEKINSFRQKLTEILNHKNIKIAGAYSYLGYNAPYQIIARTNEIIIPVVWNE